MATRHHLPNHEDIKLVDVSLFVVIIFGLCGAFISNLVEQPKLHYAPLLVAVLLAIVTSLKRGNIAKYLMAVLLIILSPLFATETNSYLSYFSSIVLPIFWFGAGKYIHPEKIANWLLTISGLLIFGAIIEILGVIPGLFPYIGVKLTEVSSQRYGSFTLNPLALGYYASISGILFLLIKSPTLKYIGIASSIVLLVVANSRGGIVTFLFALIFFWFLKNRESYESRRLRKELRYIVYTIAIVLLLAFAIYNPRLNSIFDWTGDEGNLGRLNQWGYCLTQISNNPLRGLGAGAMSSIGIGDDPYIEEGVVKSCDSTLLKIGVEYNSITAIAYFLALSMLIVKAMPRKALNAYRFVGSIFDNKYCVIIALVCSIFMQQFINQTLESVWIGALFFGFLGYCHARLDVMYTIKKSAGISKGSIALQNYYSSSDNEFS